MTMRYRTRNTIANEASEFKRTIWTVLPDTGYSQVGYLIAWGQNTPYDYIPTDASTMAVGQVGTFEQMWDLPAGHGSYNEVLHLKTEWDFPLRSISYVGESTRNYGKLGHCETQGLVSAGVSRAQGYTSGGALWDSSNNALVRACSNMQFGVQDVGTDLPTFLGELRDFAHIFEAVKEGIFRLRVKGASADHFRKLIRRQARKGVTLSDLFKTLASADLLFQFAIKPLVADIKNMMKAGQHLASQLERLNNQKPQFVRGSVVDEGSSAFFSSSSYHPYYRNTECRRLITAWAKVLYSIPAMPSTPLVWADMYGFDNLHRAAWELTRWSFLVDYIVQVGDFLKQFEGNFVEMPYTILQQGYSEKFESVQEVSTHYDGGAPYSTEYWNVESTRRIVKGTVKYSSYRRTPGPLPFGAIAYPVVKLPNLRQVINFTELMYLLGGR